MRLIYDDDLKRLVDEEWFDCREKSSFFDEIDRTPTIDAVPVGAYEQTRWERDMAISQLAEIGKSLCEKMDNVATVVRCKDCRWKEQEQPGMVYCPATVGGWVDEEWFCKGGERSEDD